MAFLKSGASIKLVTSVGSTIAKGVYTVLFDFPWMVCGPTRARGAHLKPMQYSFGRDKKNSTNRFKMKI
jgi:hypothetical protein